MTQSSFEDISALNKELKAFHKKKGCRLLDRVPPPKDFRTTRDRDAYWDEEKKRWHEGHTNKAGIWLPGSMYHFVQEQWIKNRVEGDIFRPTARLVEYIMHTKGDECYKGNKALGILKGRGASLSTYGAGCLPNYFSYIKPGSNSGMTSVERAKIDEIFTEKFLVTFEGYNPVIAHEIMARRSSTQLQRYGALTKDSDGNIKQVVGKIDCRETSDSDASVTAFSGSGCKYIFADELPLHKRRDKFMRSAIETLRDPTTKKMTGFFLYGGTAEEKLTNEDLWKFKTMVENKSVIEGDVVFLPFWVTMFIDENGFPDEDRAMKWWDSEMERFDKANDSESAHAHKRTNPRNLDDIFEEAKGGYFSSTAEDKIQARIQILNKNTDIVEIPTKLVNMGNEITRVITRHPNVYIVEPPLQDVQYYIVIDGVNTGLKSALAPGKKIKSKDRENTKRSKVAALVIKGADPIRGNSYDCVAMYTEIPDTPEEAYIHIENLFLYYNQYGGFQKYNGIEFEASGAVTDSFPMYLTERGLIQYAVRRKDYSGKRNIDTDKVGQPVTIDTLEFCVRRANPFIDKYINNINNIRLLRALLGDAYVNNDIRSAWMLFFIVLPLNFDKEVERKEPKPVMKLYYERNERGIRVPVWREEMPETDSMKDNKKKMKELQKKYSDKLLEMQKKVATAQKVKQAVEPILAEIQKLSEEINKENSLNLPFKY